MFVPKRYNMKKSVANETLQNVFAACNKTPNSTNFDLLIFKGIAQTTLVSTCKWIATGLIFVTLVAPVSLINTDFKVDTGGIASDKILVKNHELYSDCFILYLQGENIKYDSIYAKDNEGNVLFPQSTDTTNQVVVFPYSDKSLTIYIPDSDGHTLTARLSAYSSDEVYVPEPDNKE